MFPPSPAPGPSGIRRITAKARGPAEEYEEERERERRFGQWEYVEGKRAQERGEEERSVEMEEDKGGRSGYEPQRNRTNRRDRVRTETGREGQYRQAGRRNSERGVNRGREEGDRYPSRRKVEAIVVHKSEKSETYADILKRVKNNINIEELGIVDTRIRRTVTGALLIQIAEENSKRQADALADEMRRVVGEDARVGRPCRKAEVRISGLDEDTTTEVVANAIVRYGDCDKLDVRVGGIKRNRLGEGDVWVKCSWTCANELCKKGRIRIGWVGARVYMMEPAPIQCFKCWEFGHMKIQCRNTKDRTNRCYRCGNGGHRAAECNEAPQCMLCKDNGRVYNHRMGSKECSIKNSYKSGKT